MNNDTADILIVDDTPDNLRLLSNMLIQQGYNVRKAINGKMALTAVQTVLPDLILLDIMMPDMTGHEVCQQLKAEPATAKVPIIFISALNETFDKVKSFQVGGADYITKPFKLEEVLVRVQNQLSIRALQAELNEKNSKLQKALDELKQAQSQLVEQEKMSGLGQLVAGIAHEINNPVNFIAGNLAHARQYFQDLLNFIKLYQQEYPHLTPPLEESMEDLDLEFLSLDLPKLMNSMQTGAERIQAIVLGLRSFYRLDEADIKSIDLHKGIDSTLMLLRYRLKGYEKRPEIKIIKEYGDLPAVTCYANHINQVFFSLFNNAIDAIEAVPIGELKTPTIWISTEQPSNSAIIIRIKDNGAGISEEAQARVFEPFFTTKPIGKGKGLGLSASYSTIVERHNGRLTYHSSSGKGTEFTIEIPVSLMQQSGDRSKDEGKLNSHQA